MSSAMAPFCFVQVVMGYETNRFQGDVDEELICPICSGVLEEPLQVKQNKKNMFVNCNIAENDF